MEFIEKYKQELEDHTKTLLELSDLHDKHMLLQDEHIAILKRYIEAFAFIKEHNLVVEWGDRLNTMKLLNSIDEESEEK